MSSNIKRLMNSCEDDCIGKRFVNDDEYKKYADDADDYISAVREELADSQKLELLLRTLEKCNEIEKQYAFQDGIRFGYELRKIIAEY